MLGYCSAMGASGWLLMIGLWGAFIALIVWLATRIFPSDTVPVPGAETRADGRTQ